MISGLDLTKKTICVAGKNSMASNVLEYCCLNLIGYNIVCIPNKNESITNAWNKSLIWYATKYDVPIVSLEDVYDLDDLLFLSLEFDKIIKTNYFKSKDLYNVHFSLLPEYKGMYPSVMPILHGKRYSGVTLHRIDDGIDTGDIVAQKRIAISSEMTSFQLYNALGEAGEKLVCEWLPALLSGKVNTFPQSSNGSTYVATGAINFKSVCIDTLATAYQIKNQVRAFNFRPYQLITFNDSKIVGCSISKCRSKCKPGVVLAEDDLSVTISAIDYNVKLLKDTFELCANAIREDRNSEAKRYVSSKYLLSEKEEHGWSLLMIAVYSNNLEMTKWLIDKGSDISAVNNNGTTLLMYAKDAALRDGDARIYKMLLELGLREDQCDYTGKTIRDYCSANEMDQICALVCKPKK